MTQENQISLSRQKDCLPCAKGSNEYEDVILNKIIEFLEKVTCTRWIRAYTEGARPEQDEVEKGVQSPQFGTVQITSLTVSDKNYEQEGLMGDKNGDGCIVIKHFNEIDVQLRVYGHRGCNSNGLPYGSPLDVLWRINSLYGIPRLKDVLTAEGLAINDFGRITNSVEIRNSSYEHNAGQTLSFCVERKTTITQDVFDSICISSNQNCEKDN